MIDYDELVKALENCSSMNGSCARCPYHTTIAQSCKWEMLKDAAKAIKELREAKR